MHARRPTTADARNEFALPTRAQPPTADAASTSPRALPRALDVPTADLPEIVDNPGAIEYASWIRLLRTGRA